jgi:hypothetical protein
MWPTTAPSTQREILLATFPIEVCAVFFSVLYNSAVFMADKFRHPTLGIEIKGASFWRMIIINGVLGIGIVGSRITACTKLDSWDTKSWIVIGHVCLLIILTGVRMLRQKDRT